MLKHYRIEPLSKKFSIVKDSLWCIYDGTQPVFHGTVTECRNWLDEREALAVMRGEVPDDEPADVPPQVSVWKRLHQIMFTVPSIGRKGS